jgi:hypothetical protein
MPSTTNPISSLIRGVNAISQRHGVVTTGTALTSRLGPPTGHGVMMPLTKSLPPIPDQLFQPRLRIRPNRKSRAIGQRGRRHHRILCPNIEHEQPNSAFRNIRAICAIRGSSS